MSKNLMAEFLKDSSSISITDDELSEISKLAKQQKELETNVKQLESDLDTAKEALRQVQEFLLPEAMATVGMKEFKLTDGTKITIRDDVYASIRKDYLYEATNWLYQKGLGGIVKEEVICDFGKKDHDRMLRFIEFCKQQQVNAVEKVSVHPQTLKATVKEQLAHGVQFPEEFFSVGPLKKAIIK